MAQQEQVIFLDLFHLLKIKMQKFLPLLDYKFTILCFVRKISLKIKLKHLIFYSLSITTSNTKSMPKYKETGPSKLAHNPFPKRVIYLYFPLLLLPFIALYLAHSYAIQPSLITASNSTCLCRWKLGLWRKKGNLMREVLPIITNIERKNWLNTLSNLGQCDSDNLTNTTSRKTIFQEKEATRFLKTKYFVSSVVLGDWYAEMCLRFTFIHKSKNSQPCRYISQHMKLH